MTRGVTCCAGIVAVLMLTGCGGGTGDGAGGGDPPTDPTPTTGTVVAETETTGEDLDPDGYSVTLSPDRVRDIGVNDQVEFVDVLQGDHEIALQEIAANCDVEGENPVSLSVQAGTTTDKLFSVVCRSRLGEDVIAFMSDSTDDALDIALINADGTGFRALAPADGRDVRPDWSPDGSRIVFESDRTGVNRRDLFVAEVSGENVTRLTTDPGFDTHPDWSPDGEKIVFSTEMGANVDLATVNPDGTGLTNITQDSAESLRPAWSPDGALIAFERTPLDGARGLYVVKPDGTELRKIANGGTKPAWSPDGSRVVVGGGDLVVINVSDTSKTVLISSGTSNDPVWSPDGNWIAFARRGHRSDNSDANDIFVIRPDGTDLRNLTDDPGTDTQPSWSEDSNSIAFTRTRLDNRDIFVVNLDGNVTRLTEREGADAGPSWSRGRN